MADRDPQWRRPAACSADNGCVEVAWRRPADCSANNCVEVAPVGGRWLIRDGKLGDSSPVLEFTPGEMAAFVKAARAGEYD